MAIAKPGDLVLVSSGRLGVFGLFYVDRVDAEDSLFASEPSAQHSVRFQADDVVSVFAGSPTGKRKA